MNRFTSLLTGAGLGAGFMYFFDPDRGNRRRSLLRDQMRHAVAKSGRGADATLRDVQNRIYGTVAEVRGMFSPDDAPDNVIVSRVRSKMGRYVTNASSIKVECRDGNVTLRGPILAHEVDDFIAAVSSVKGVRSVRNYLDVHESRGNISALQGGGQRWGEPASVMQTYWSPTTRVAAGALGGLMMVRCLTRPSTGASLSGTFGFGLLLRALTNLETKRLLGIRGRRGVDFHKTITINKPVEEVFELLADPARYPEFSDMVVSVHDEGGGSYRKTMVGPAGAELTIHERITRNEPNQFVAFRSEPDSPVQYSGRAWFMPVDDSTTKVEVQATYNPPGGVLTHGAAWLVGLDPRSLMHDTMMRAKAYLETGEAPHDAAGKEHERQAAPVGGSPQLPR